MFIDVYSISLHKKEDMEYTFNNVKVESVKDGWFKSSVFNVFIGSNSFKHTELNSLNQDNIIRPSKKGRGSCVLVNGKCIKEWISKSYRLSLFEKKFFIHELFVQGLVSDSDISLRKIDESEFFFELKSFMESSGINFTIERQYPIEPYCVDILINKSIVVEIDENRHIGYDKIDEINRTNFLIGKGYKIIRIDNKVNIGKFIGIVYKCIMDNNFELYKTY